MTFATSGQAILCCAAGLLGGTFAGASLIEKRIAGIVALAIGCVLAVIQ